MMASRPTYPDTELLNDAADISILREDFLETASVKDVEVDLASTNDGYIGSKISCLEKLDQLCIKKGVKLRLSRTHVNTEIYDSQNQKLFLVRQEIEQLCCCYLTNRWQDMNVTNLEDEEILVVSRHVPTGTANSWRRLIPRLPSIDIFLSPKYRLGRIKRDFGLYPIRYSVEDEAGNCTLKIRSRFSFPYLYFDIIASDNSSILGKISRDRPEGHHIFSRYYSVHLFFPDLPVKTKALLLGSALVLVSVIQYEMRQCLIKETYPSFGRGATLPNDDH